ncbi:MAG: flagellar biosynthesis protein FlgJ [Hyphomicrobiales bacterium]|nr:MAG: flagellar biosynthesis protein FlgJ [Hyphomicrobiales bacterium]
MNPLSAPVAATTGAAPTVPSPKNAETARSFEAVFIGQMTQLMLESVESGEFSGGHGEQMFRGVMAEHLGTAISAKGGLGLAPYVLEQIIKLQGAASNGN